MICINDDIIQKYIDGEASQPEVTFIENHLASCNKCTEGIENQRKLSNFIKKGINLLANDNVKIPEFEIPSRNIKKRVLTPRRLYYSLAAACVFFLIIVFVHSKESKVGDEIRIDTASIVDFDANRTVSQLPLVISIIDSKGNFSEYIIN